MRFFQGSPRPEPERVARCSLDVGKWGFYSELDTPKDSRALHDSVNETFPEELSPCHCTTSCSLLACKQEFVGEARCVKGNSLKYPQVCVASVLLRSLRYHSLEMNNHRAQNTITHPALLLQRPVIKAHQSAVLK